MPTLISHGVFAVCAAFLYKGMKLPARFWILAIFCSLLPDVDVVGFRYGVAYEDFWGHRGFTHSLLFALLTAMTVVLVFFSQVKYRPLRIHLLIFYFLVTASHGLFDAMTDGGLGIAFFAPFDNARYFLPFQPIEVSPIGLKHFISARGAVVISSELLWIMLPSVMILAVYGIIRYILPKRPKTDI